MQPPENSPHQPQPDNIGPPQPLPSTEPPTAQQPPYQAPGYLSSAAPLDSSHASYTEPTQPNPSATLTSDPQPVVYSPAQPGAPTPSPMAPKPADDEQKDFVLAFLLSWLLGVFGADRFYLGYTGLGIVKLLTFGGLGIWAYIDVALLAFGKMKDRAGLPLRGYEKNKTWVRVLAIIHLVILGLIAAAVIFSLFITTKNGLYQKAGDTYHKQAVADDSERRADIQTIQTALKQYHDQKGYYPLSLTELSLSDETCADPLDKNGSCAFPGYTYTAYSSTGTNTGCNNTFAKCQAYVLETNRMESTVGNSNYRVTGQ